MYCFFLVNLLCSSKHNIFQQKCIGNNLVKRNIIVYEIAVHIYLVFSIGISKNTNKTQTLFNYTTP